MRGVTGGDLGGFCLAAAEIQGAIKLIADAAKVFEIVLQWERQEDWESSGGDRGVDVNGV